MHIFVIFITALFYIPLSKTKELPCNLVWKNFSFGDEVPQSIVYLNGQKITSGIAKIKQNSSTEEFKVGIFESQTSIATIDSIKYYVYDILTNINSCSVEWSLNFTNKANSFFQINGKFLGRNFNESNLEWIPVLFSENENSSNFQILKSYFSGFNTSLNKITKIDQENFLTPITDLSFTFYGTDTFVNDSPAELLQIVEQTESLAESQTDIETHNTLKANWTFNFKDEYPDKSGSGFIDTLAELSTSIAQKEKKSTLSLTKTIKVPGFSKIQMCSLSTYTDSFQTRYEILINFSLPGYNGKEVFELITSNNLPYDIIDTLKDHVIVKVKTKSTLSTNVDTKVILVDLKGNLPDCMVIKQAVQLWNKTKSLYNNVNMHYNQTIAFVFKYFDIDQSNL